METLSVIRHQLDLLIRLIDTTSGNTVSGSDVRFFTDRGEFHPHIRGDGSYLLIGTGKKDFDFTVRAFGYEDKRVEVRYSELDETMPYVGPHIVPNLYYSETSPCFTLEGRIPGLTGVDAIKLSESACLVKAFDERKRLLTVTAPHRLTLDKTYYAVVDPNSATYEPVTIIKNLSEQVFKCDRALKKPVSSYFFVCRRVFGSVSDGDGGEYLLRVRDDGSRARWVVRFTSRDGEGFATVDFSMPETLGPAPAFIPYTDDS